MVECVRWSGIVVITALGFIRDGPEVVKVLPSVGVLDSVLDLSSDSVSSVLPTMFFLGVYFFFPPIPLCCPQCN